MYIQHHILKHIIESCDDMDVRRDFKIFKPIIHVCTFIPQPLFHGIFGYYDEL